MATWLIFATWAENDEALWNSHWIAQQTRRLAPSPPQLIERHEAVRDSLELALTNDDIKGLALFGHGRTHAVMGSDKQAALDLVNVHLVTRRWVHAIACHTGAELVPAAAAHADVFVGYNVAIIVGWTLDDLPPALRDRMATMVTATTFGLLQGVRTKAELQRCAARGADIVVEWLLENTEEGHLGIYALAHQLVQRMITSR